MHSARINADKHSHTFKKNLSKWINKPGLPYAHFASVWEKPSWDEDSRGRKKNKRGLKGGFARLDPDWLEDALFSILFDVNPKLSGISINKFYIK